MTLQRLVITFKPNELVVHALYRAQDSTGPNTKARRKEITELARSGLQHALKVLECGAEWVSTSGFTQRENVHLATTSRNAHKLVKGA